MEIWKEQNYQQGIDYCSLVDKKGKTYEYVVEIFRNLPQRKWMEIQ